MVSDPNKKKKDERDPDRRILGVTRKQRFKAYGWGALILFLAGAIWAWSYLRPERWYKYTDQVAFAQVARDVKLGYVLWDESARIDNVVDEEELLGEPAISSDGARMVYTTGKADGNANLFIRHWDGNNWGAPRPMRALNSSFHEISPVFNGDASMLYFASDRPGGPGGYDIWIARWDGAEYAWPLPLTSRVNSPFDETGPAISPDHMVLYFASNRPRPVIIRKKGDAPIIQPLPEMGELSVEEVEAKKVDFDLYSADIASDTPYDLIVERQLSMLYSLREGALADIEVMKKLGGSVATESAVDKALAFLAKTQEEDGRWDMKKFNGANGHDVAATAFALLAFYGRGERHDEPCKYQDNVARGIKWLTDQQNAATGDLRGYKPQSNAMYDHGIASLCVVEAYGVTKDTDLRPRAVAAIEFMSESQHEEGGWRYRPNERGDLSVTGWMIMSLASAQMSGINVPQKTLDGASKFLDFVSGGKHGGSYGYTDPPGAGGSNRHGMNAAGFFSAQLLGHSANSTKAFESSVILDRHGAKVQNLYYLYYGTLASYQHQGPAWRKWRDAMQADLVKQQADDGSWTFKGEHTGSMGTVICTALVSLCLEAHYRYTPLYGLGYEPDPNGPAPQVTDHDMLPQPPMFRHAKHIELLHSPADETSPAVTDHGDFLYFASGREGGQGGVDLYRSRIGRQGLTEPTNMGPEINSPADETNPAVRMAGFHLMFNSNRDGNAPSLYGAKSRRVVERFDYSKMPTGAWFQRNMYVVIGFVATLVIFIWMARRAYMQGKTRGEQIDTNSTDSGTATAAT